MEAFFPGGTMRPFCVSNSPHDDEVLSIWRLHASRLKARGGGGGGFHMKGAGMLVGNFELNP